MSRSVRLTILVIAVAAFPLPACRRPAPPPPGTGVELVPVAALPADPEDGVWNMADEFIADLLPQDLVEPRKLHPTTTAVRVRAVTDGKDVAFRLEWSDPSDDDTSDPARFSDACAVQKVISTGRPFSPICGAGTVGSILAGSLSLIHI